MRTYAWVAAALAVAMTTGCEDRNRGATGDRVEAAGERAGEEIRQGANEVGDAAEDAADDVGDATREAADEVGDAFSYERRDEYREEVRERLAQMDKELADLRRGVNEDASEAYGEAVAAARETRRAVGRDVERLTDATAANWNEVRDDVRGSLDSLDRQLRALRPDARPMGGTGPS
jgi:hypothetical protein